MSDEMNVKDYTFVSDEMLESLQDDIALADAGQGWHRIGKLLLGMTRFIKWQNKKPIPIEAKEWQRTPANQRGFDMVFDIDIAEFDQRAKDEGWDFIRKVGFRSRDWYKILVPSIEEIFGEGSMGPKNYLATMSKLRGHYLDMLDVPQSPNKDGKVPTNDTTGKPYTTVKLFKVFASREEAQAAYNELRSDSSDDTLAIADHYPATWETSENVEECLGFIAKSLETKTAAETVKTLALLGTKTAKDEPVDVKALLEEAIDKLNVPELLKTGLYEKVEAYS